ncbi:MAG: zinc ABC transporter substrate-binding protein [Candidatus Competibacteraceae bacterium]|nr:zinc ABC transporter substrate-binding protein [Candidatus Competibacteraceae bacterium]
MLLLGGSLAAFAMEPKVVASIKPVHSLAAGVMQGVGEPRLLVSGGASPHEYSLKPSDTRALSEAQLVFWIGPDLESFLVKPLNNVKDRVRAVALLDAPGMMILPLRKGGAWEPHQHDHEGSDHDSKKEPHAEHEHAADHDAHIWLDPVNAIAMVRQIVAQLGEADAAHKADYERNGAALIERLNRLNQQLITELAPVKSQPYLVFHDAYQYFERRYDLSAVGSVVLSPEQRPGAKRVADIQARIHDLHARCVFSEPQFQPALVETVIAGSTARRGVLDPLGAELTAGPEAYFQLVQGLSSSLRACLSGS